MDELAAHNHHVALKSRLSPQKISNQGPKSHVHPQVGTVVLYGVPIVSLMIESQERLCLAQISNTLLKQFSYNEIHNRRVALGITCVQCTPVQLEILRRAGAMPVSSRRCGMITRREAERLCKSFLGDNAPPRLPDDFAFSVHHECAWGCRGAFLPARYNSSRAKCIKCSYCGLFFSPNKFIFHSHRTSPSATYVQPDAANFNSWRRHMKLSGSPPDNIVFAWEDVKAMFNGGTRKRMLSGHQSQSRNNDNPSTGRSSPPAPPAKQLKLESPPMTPTPYPQASTTPAPISMPHRVPPFPDLPIPITMMDYVWHGMDGLKPSFLSPYLPWFSPTKRGVLNYGPLLSSPDSESQALTPFHSHGKYLHQSAFRPVFPAVCDAPLRPRKAGMDPKDDRTSSPSDASKEDHSKLPDVLKSSDSSDTDDSVTREKDSLSKRLGLARPDLLRTLSCLKQEQDASKTAEKRDEAGEETENEDETVDIETTDDVSDQPLREDGLLYLDSNSTVKERDVSPERSPEILHSRQAPRIWTVARFSLDEPENSSSYCHDSSCKNVSSSNDKGLNLTTTGPNAIVPLPSPEPVSPLLSSVYISSEK